MSGLVPERKRNIRGISFYDPFAHMDELFDGMFGSKEIELFRNMKTDIFESESKYLIEMELPGFKKENIEIDINGNTLTVNAKREEIKGSEDVKGSCVHLERSTGMFSRSFNIKGVDRENICAEYKEGILSITLPKVQIKETVPVKINIL